MAYKSPKRRPKCGKRTIDEKTISFGGCVQTNADNNTTWIIYTNTTKAAGLGDGSGAATPPISIYARPFDVTSQPTCGTYDEYECGDGLNGNIPCTTYGGPDPTEVNITPEGTQIPVGIYTNSIIDSGVTGSLEHCKKTIGRRQVYANRMWQGRPTFTSQEWGMASSVDDCGNCSWIGYKPTPEYVRYLGVTGTATYHSYTNDYSEGGISTAVDANASATNHVGRYTGVVDVQSTNSSSTHPSGSGIDTVVGLLGLDTTNWTNVVTAFYSHVGPGGDLFGQTPTSKDGDATSGWTFTYTAPSLIDGSPYTYAVISFTLSGHFSYDTYGFMYPVGGGPDLVLAQTSHTELQYTATTIAASGWSYGSTRFLDGGSEYSCTISLYDPFTTAQVQSELTYLSSLIELGDPQLNWRTDYAVCAGPLVRYNETGPSQPVLWSVGDIQPTHYDGRVLGQLSPYVISNGIFNPAHLNYAVCNDPFACGGTGGDFKYIRDMGQWSTTGCATPAATNWVNLWEQGWIPQGAFNCSGQTWTTPSTCNFTEHQVTGDSTLWLCKYAEIIIEKPSFNYARPQGVDRLQIEAGSNRCCITASGNVLTLEDYDSTPTTLATGDYAWVNGFGADQYNGVWSITKLGDYSIQLNTFVASASQFSTTPFPDNLETAWIGKCKWFGAAGIDGRVGLVSLSPTNPSTASFESPCHLVAGDRVIVSGSLGFKIDNVAITVQQVIDSQTVILAINAISQSYTSGSGQIYSFVSMDYRWDDSGSKGDYVVHKWLNNYRDVGEWDRLEQQYNSIINQADCFPGTVEEPDLRHSCSASPRIAEPRPWLGDNGCLPQTVESSTHETHCLLANSCGPSVAYFSPNTETLLDKNYNTKNHGWVWTAIDTTYGNMWQGLIQQYDTDYAWQAPPCPCSQENIAADPEVDDPIIKYTCNCEWVEDDGSCYVDVEGSDDPDLPIPCTKYYVSRPYVEARADIPDGAPAYFRSSVRFLNVNELVGGCIGIGRTMYPPVNGGHFVFSSMTYSVSLMPYWSLFLNRYNCSCNGGRWQEEYNQQMITCNIEGVS